MAGLRNGLVAALCAASVVASGCENGGGSGGDGPFGSEAPTSPEQATNNARAALKGCTDTCSANTEDGRQALAQGDVAGALESFHCANTPEAAFGAGLATLLGAVESERMDRVAADFGLEHFAADNIVGPDGWLSRQSARWDGSGMLTLGGDLSAEVPIHAAMAPERYDSFDQGELDASGSGETFDIDLQIYSYGQLAVGSPVSLLYDCASVGGSASLVTSVPQLYLIVEERATGTSYDCTIPFSRNATFCQRELGSLQLLAGGSAIGEEVTIAFDNTGLSCIPYEGERDGLEREIVVTGTVTAKVSGDVDTSDLHELMSGDLEYGVARIPEKVTVNALLAHGTGLSQDFARAACLFEEAAKGDDDVFVVPSGLLGGEDIALRAADAKLLGALSALGASMLQLGGAYASQLPLRELACMFADGEDDGGVCGETAAHVQAINEAIAGAGVRRDRLAASRTFLLDALTRFQDAVPMLDESSLFPRNAASAGGLDAMSAIANALEESLTDGSAVLPFITPTVEMSLLELFTKPPEPSSVKLAAFLYEEECDEFGCWSHLEVSRSFCSRLWSPIGFNFEQDYESTREADQLSEAFDELWKSLDSRKVFGGDAF